MWGEVVGVANVESPAYTTDIDSEGVVAVCCKSCARVLGRYEPFRETQGRGPRHLRA
jgi:hypothetical protein